MVSWMRLALSVAVTALCFASLPAAGSAQRPPQPVDVRWARAIVVRSADLSKDWTVSPPATDAGYVQTVGGCRDVPNAGLPSGLAYAFADGPNLGLESVDSYACVYPTARQASAFAQAFARSFTRNLGTKSYTKGKLRGTSVSVEPHPIPGAPSLHNFRTVFHIAKPKGESFLDAGYVRVGRVVLELIMGGVPASTEARVVHELMARMAHPPGRPA
jgi:hypothetical protein